MRKQHILLIDDDEEEFEIFSFAIGKIPLSLNCTYANSPRKAIELLQHLVPDFIFVDMNMPAINGLKCISAIKDIDKCSNVPIFIYSTYIDDEVARKAKAMGVEACIKKPLETKRLVEILYSVLNNYQ